MKVNIKKLVASSCLVLLFSACAAPVPSCADYVRDSQAALDNFVSGFTYAAKLPLDERKPTIDSLYKIEADYNKEPVPDCAQEVKRKVSRSMEVGLNALLSANDPRDLDLSLINFEDTQRAIDRLK